MTPAGVLGSIFLYADLVSTWYELHFGVEARDAVPLLRNLGGWLGGLGTHAEPILGAYAEWLATMPALCSPEKAAATVERFAGIATQEAQEEAWRCTRNWRTGCNA